MSENIEEGVLYAESMYGLNTREPIVKISYGITFECQMSPTEAREFALSVLAAAEGAETDAFMVDWLAKNVKITDPAKVALFISDFRRSREQETAIYSQPIMPPAVTRAVAKSRRICQCGHNFLAHQDDDGKDVECALIGCKCAGFVPRS